MSPSRALPCLILFFVTTLAHGLSVPSDAEIQKKLAARLKGKDDYSERNARRVGNRTIEVEGFISLDGELELTKEILAEPKEYARWLLPNINTRPSGGEYLVKIMGMELAPESTNVLITKLSFDLPLFKKEIDCHVKVGSERKGNRVVLNATIDTLQGTYIEHFQAVLQFFQREKGKLWVYALGEVRFKHWLVYEALPDRLLNRETGERLQIAIDNYLNEENHRRSQKRKSTSTAPIIKGGSPKRSRP